MEYQTLLPVNISSSCRICDRLCTDCVNCIPGYCWTFNVLSIVSFAILFVVLTVRLGMFQHYKPFPILSIKKIAYALGVFACITRILRGALVFVEYQETVVGLFFDQILYWFGGAAIITMYSLLIQFWAGLCRKSNVRMTLGLEGASKRVFILGNLLLFGVATLIPVLTLFITSYFVVVGIVCALGAIVLIFALIALLREGRNVYRLISSFTGDTPGTGKTDLLRTTNGLVLKTAVVFLVGIVWIGTWGLILKFVTNVYSFCQSGFVMFRILEFSLVAILAYSLRQTVKPEASTQPESDSKGDVQLARNSTEVSVELQPGQ